MRETNVDRGRRSLLTGRLDRIRPAEVHITSLVVYGDPARLTVIADTIGQMPGAEIHANDGVGKLVVVLETTGETDMAAAIDRIDRTAGVFCTALVYQQAEPLEHDDKKSN